jgi:18S rRNA (guanine1575-N7)-methyltransferase
MAVSNATRPEHAAAADAYYDATEARKYTSSSRIIDIQAQMAQRCLELLALPPKRKFHILDIGCGSGLSGGEQNRRPMTFSAIQTAAQTIASHLAPTFHMIDSTPPHTPNLCCNLAAFNAAEVLSSKGHSWVGTDISGDMISVGISRGVNGDTVLADMGQGLAFRPACFDGAVSVSAVQWLCYATQKSHNPKKRVVAFFASLYRCLKRGARAALQIYPESVYHLELLTTAAARAGFRGGLVVDYPNSTKAKKYYLCLVAGAGKRDDTESGLAASAAAAESSSASSSAAGGAASGSADSGGDVGSSSGVVLGSLDLTHSITAMKATGDLGRALTGAGLTVAMGHRSSPEFQKRRSSKAADRSAARAPGRREWIHRKKDQRRLKGLKVKADSKYTGRRRPDRIT